MTTQPRFTFHLPLPAFALAMLGVLIMLAMPGLAQSLTVLHNFTGGADGSYPTAGVTFDQQGRIYGTASGDGRYDSGVVYRLVHEGGGWVLTPIYSFNFHDHDGTAPYSRVVFGPDGLLYGTTNTGGTANFGTVFSLRPPATACTTAVCSWDETILYSFTGGADGGYPYYGDLIFDQAGNMYGTAYGGGSSGAGVVFKLTRSGSGWAESVPWSFTRGSDGANPLSGVIFDDAGNLYGTTSSGSSNRLGAVYELSPTQSGWSETTLYSFTNNDNGGGSGSLIMDAHGDLFGITGNEDGGGAAYELTPQNGTWSFTLLQAFQGEFGGIAAPTFDSHRNLYGPLPNGGSDDLGEVFRLTPSGDQWLYTPYYQFNSSGAGAEPTGALIFDASGNMYGTAFVLGTGGEGTVWEITP